MIFGINITQYQVQILLLGCMQTDVTLLANNSRHCCMLHVASVCTPCCMLLDVVGRCCAKFETGQTFSPVQTDATLLAYNSQHCWELLRPFVCSLTRILILLHEKFLQFDWLRAMVFQLNLKYLQVKITKLLRVVSSINK